MNKKEETLLNSFPKHQDNLKEQLKNDNEYAQMWLDSLLEDYSETKDVNDLIYNLKPLIEAKYTICEFAKLNHLWQFCHRFLKILFIFFIVKNIYLCNQMRTTWQNRFFR